MKMRVRIPWRKRQRQTDNVDPDVAVLRLRGGFELEADGGAICCMIIAFIVVEIIFFLFQYFDVYRNVYPGSTVAQNLSGGKGTAYDVFKWMICWCTGSLTFPLGVYLAVAGIGVVGESNVALACLIALPWIAICLFVGTWQMWIYWMMNAVWYNDVWNNACNGWDGYAILAGTQWMDISSSLPYCGIATVFLAAGNYSMQLERNGNNHNVFTFYNMQTGNLTPTYPNITYNIFNHTYTIDNVTNHYTVSPNLAFPALDLQLSNPSIPFSTGQCDMPLADLMYSNGTVTSEVLSVVNVDSSDCTQLKVCTNTNPEGDYEIALGVLMIQQFAYGICCTAPSSSDSSSGTTVVLSVNFGSGGSG